MSGIFDSNSVNTMLSGLGNSNTGNSSFNGLYGVNLSDYASIRNGSYGKLLKSYYAMENGETEKETNSKNDTDDTDATLASIKRASSDLKESAAAIYSSKSLFEKNADGAYNMEAIYEKVNAFIEDYNSLIASVGSAETESIAKAGANMVNAAINNTEMLSKIGISVNTTDFTLSVDKEKFLNSNIADMKSLFNGVGSFAYQIGAKASRIHTMVADKVTTAGSYSSGKAETSSSTSKEDAGTIAKVKEKANNLLSTGTDIYKNSMLFQKKADGSYDTEKILDEVETFMKAYNELIAAAENTKSSGISNAIKVLEATANNYQKELKELGITMDKEDGTLKLDERAFRKSDMKKAKTLFCGTGSFAYQVTAKAAMVVSQAETEANKSNTYTDNALYSNNHNTGAIFNGLV